MEIIVGLLIVSHVAVGWLAVRLFQYGLLYGRHWNFQEKVQDAPSNPSQTPARSKVPPTTAELKDWAFPPPEVPAPDFRSDQANPFAEPAIGGKDAIPPAAENI